MATLERSVSGGAEHRLPISRSLVYPPDGSVMEGRSVFFQWDLRDAQKRCSRSRLVVKRQLVGQSADEAIGGDEIAFETLVEHVQFFSMDIADLRARSASYVWQVIASTTTEDGKLIATAASQVRTFQLASSRVELDRLISTQPTLDSRENERHETEAAPTPRLGGPCPNGDLETGTLAGWQGYYGSRLNSSGINLNSLSAGIVNTRHTIRALLDGFDPVLSPLGVNMPQVGEGTYSVRLGNSVTNGEADVLAYTFTVNAQNKNFTFRYAVVLQNPSDHAADEQPFFMYFILRGSSILFSPTNLPVAGREIVADSSNPFFKTIDGIVYREWTPVCTDLSQYLGQTMTIVFLTADCSQGGHFGYAYIDGLCLSNEAIASFTMSKEICASATLLADGSASSNETSCFWSIEESDANGGRNPATEVYQWFVAQQAGPINLTAFYASKGGHFKCNTYYRIKLAVSNDCTPWNETVELLHVKCPIVTAGPDACVSCTPNGQTIRLGVGTPAPPGTTFAWSPSAGLDYPFSPSPLHTQGSVQYPVTYTVTATDSTGCSNSDQVTLYCKPPTVVIRKGVECCKVTLIARAAGAASIQWSTGQSGVYSIEVTIPGTYTVTVTNPCGTATASAVVSPLNLLIGDFHAVSFNDGFSPGSGSAYTTPKDKMYIADIIIGAPPGIIGVPNSYNATDYILEIFDRWGNLFKTVTGHSCDGFPNWSIAWDGTDNQGNFVQQDVYVWKLRFKNCQFQGWRPATIRRFVKPQCIKWATFLGIKLWCKEYDVPPGTTVDDNTGIGSVTVV